MCLTIKKQIVRGAVLYALFVNHIQVGILFASVDSLMDAVEALS